MCLCILLVIRQHYLWIDKKREDSDYDSDHDGFEKWNLQGHDDSSEEEDEGAGDLVGTRDADDLEDGGEVEDGGKVEDEDEGDGDESVGSLLVGTTKVEGEEDKPALLQERKNRRVEHGIVAILTRRSKKRKRRTME